MAFLEADQFRGQHLMDFIGKDDRENEHWVPKGEDKLHDVDPLCGCNPDSECNESPHYPSSDKLEYFWIHHQLN